MLDRLGSTSASIGAFEDSAPVLRGIAFQEFIHFLRRQTYVVGAVTATVVLLAVGYVLSTPPSYTATAHLIIDSKIQLLKQQSVVSDLTADTPAIESQVEILKSDAIALKVIKDLRLAYAPEFTGHQGGFVAAIFAAVSDFFSGEDKEKDLARRALRSFEKRLSVKRVGLTYVISVSFRSVDPQQAAKIANALVEAYITDQLEAKYQATRRAAAWLQDRIKELREQATVAETAVVAFKTKNNIVDAGGRLMSEQQLAELNSQLLVAKAQSNEARARLNRIETVLNSTDSNTVGTVADTFNNAVVTKLRQQYLDLAAREADWSARYGFNHLAAVNLRNQMREISGSVRDELKRLAESYKSDVDISQRREDDLIKSLSVVVAQSQETNQAQVALRELESNAQTYRALHDNFLQRYMESVQQQSFPITEARVISPAAPPIQASHPQTLLILALAGMGGLLLGIGVGTARDLANRVFRTGSEVERVLAGNCLAVFPKLKANKAQLGSQRQAAIFPNIQHGGLLKEIMAAPFSRFAESLRSLKLASDLSSVGQESKVIGFTSSLPNEGKTLLASSFALMTAKAGAKVILIDADLRNPSSTRLLAPKSSKGVLQLLAGEARLQDVIWKDEATGLSFLPAAVEEQLANSSEILASPSMSKLVSLLRQHYQYVVLDCSPVSPIVDVRFAAPLVDQFIYVIEWGRTTQDVVRHVLHGASDIREKVLGFVLNSASMNTLSRYDGYTGYYYKNKAYTRYGYGE